MLGNQQPIPANVAERLEQWVLENFEPGSLLPSEKELAETFHVSRLTIREAMKTLVGRGLIETRQGRRAQVSLNRDIPFSSFLTHARTGEPSSMLDLAEIRMALEVQSATLAATRASRAGIAAIENALDVMRAAADAVDKSGQDSEPTDQIARYIEADVRFHEALALASGNRILSALLESIEVPLRKSFDFSVKNQIVDGRVRLNQNVQDHAEILDFVRNGEVRKAASAMRSHLKQSKRDLSAGLRAQMQPVRSGPALSYGSETDYESEPSK